MSPVRDLLPAAVSLARLLAGAALLTWLAVRVQRRRPGPSVPATEAEIADWKRTARPLRPPGFGGYSLRLSGRRGWPAPALGAVAALVLAGLLPALRVAFGIAAAWLSALALLLGQEHRHGRVARAEALAQEAAGSAARPGPIATADDADGLLAIAAGRRLTGGGWGSQPILALCADGQARQRTGINLRRAALGARAQTRVGGPCPAGATLLLATTGTVRMHDVPEGCVAGWLGRGRRPPAGPGLRLLPQGRATRLLGWLSLGCARRWSAIFVAADALSGQISGAAAMTDLPAPLVFQPWMEQPEDNETLTGDALMDEMDKIQSTVFADSGHAIRSVHAKAHALLDARLTVHDGLPEPLRQGLFAVPASYAAVMRFSTLPGDLLDDSVSTPRGVALKVIGVPGARLPDSADDTTQDFVMVDGPAFAAPDAAHFLSSLKLLARTTDRAPAAKEVLSHVARGLEHVLEAFGGTSGTLIRLGGQPGIHILGETFFSQTPFLYGPYMAKFSLAPSSPGLRALTGAALDVDAAPDALRAAVRAHFATQGGQWQLRVQLCTNLDAMPIEDASVPWPEEASPHIPVATIDAPPQDSFSEANRLRVDEAMSFAPWHGLAAHRPLGSVNRARRHAYTHSAAFRGSRNGCPMREPVA